MKILITGGAGFIGSALIRHIINSTSHEVLNLDALKYSGNLDSLNEISTSNRYQFIKEDICNFQNLLKKLRLLKPDLLKQLIAKYYSLTR